METKEKPKRKKHNRLNDNLALGIAQAFLKQTTQT